MQLPLPENEASRLGALCSYGLLDTRSRSGLTTLPVWPPMSVLPSDWSASSTPSDNGSSQGSGGIGARSRAKSPSARTPSCKPI